MHEKDQYNNFKEKYLGVEGAFSEFRVSIGLFYNYPAFDQTAGEELKRRGFNYDKYLTTQSFLDTLHQYDIAWIISNNSLLGKEEETRFIQKIGEFMKSGKSLFIWADNQPYFQHANLILKHYFDGMNLVGDYYGGKIVTKQNELQQQSFISDHPIAYGLNNIHEGITICHPEKIHPDFKIFAKNSQNNALILYAEKNESHGRIIVDTGFTKVFTHYWNGAGTHQYVSNANVWLTGVETIQN